MLSSTWTGLCSHAKQHLLSDALENLVLKPLHSQVTLDLIPYKVTPMHHQALEKMRPGSLHLCTLLAAHIPFAAAIHQEIFASALTGWQSACTERSLASWGTLLRAASHGPPSSYLRYSCQPFFFSLLTCCAWSRYGSIRNVMNGGKNITWAHLRA